VAAAEAFWLTLCSSGVKVNKIAGEDDETGAHWLSFAAPADASTAPAAAPVYWFGQMFLGQHLYVRRSYRCLYDIVDGIWRNNMWVLMLGSPGTSHSSSQPSGRSAEG
jgi:hypothetical protein